MNDELKMRLECAVAYLAELNWTEELTEKDRLVEQAAYEIRAALKTTDAIIAAAQAWADAYRTYHEGPFDDVSDTIKAYSDATQALRDAVAESTQKEIPNDR